MDLFVLDRLVIIFARKLMNDSMLQFGVLTALWLVVQVALPSKNKKVKK